MQINNQGEKLEKLKLAIALVVDLLVKNGLTISGLTVNDVLEKKNFLYHKVYRIARDCPIDLGVLWILSGLETSRIPAPSLADLKIWIEYKKFENKKWEELPEDFTRAALNYSKKNGLSKDKLCRILNIEYTPPKIHIYDFLEEIRCDLENKKLLKSTPKEISRYDNGKTYANIESYANRNGISLAFVWRELQVPLHRRYRINSNNELERKPIYESVEEIADDIINLGLYGKSPRDVQDLDSNKTCKNITVFAKKHKIPLSELWEKVGIKYQKK